MIILIVFIVLLERTANNQKKTIELLTNNNRAYEKELAGLVNQGGVYRLTIDQLNTSIDSAVNVINKVRKDLGISDKNLKEITAISAKLNVRDTIIVYRDSMIFEKISDCNFQIEHAFNDFTFLSATMTDGFFVPEINISDNFYLFQYQNRIWRQPEFLKRLVTFNWGKYTMDEFKFDNDNKLNNIKDIKVIKIEK